MPAKSSFVKFSRHSPLVLAGPGVPQGKVIEGLGSNIDTAPTLLDLSGLPPLAATEGHSFIPLMRGELSAVN